MGKKDRQHYVSQSYLRNFSPDLIKYLRTKDNLEDRQKKKFKQRMKIHYFDTRKNIVDIRNIYSLAKVDHYFLPIIDKIVRETENKLSLLQEIIENKSEDYLYQDNHQETLWEIANSLAVRSAVFRKMAEFSNSRLRGNIIDRDGESKGTITYTKESAELIQSMGITDDMEILSLLIPKSFKVTMHSDNIEGTIDQIFEEKGIEKTLLEEQSKTKEPKQTHIPNTVYPILIENNTELQFITGDMCVPKTEYVLSDLKTRIPFYYFPINPDFAVMFLEEKELEKHFPRKITEIEIHKMNRLIYNCSINYLFSNKPEPLQLTTKEPKED